MAQLSTDVQLKDASGAEVNPASQETLASIAADVRPLSGSGTSGTRDLTVADTWYTVPSSAPASDYLLVVSKESVSGTSRWSFSNSSAPSATFGNKITTNDLVIELSANEVIYISSSNAGDDFNWTTKII